MASPSSVRATHYFAPVRPASINTSWLVPLHIIHMYICTILIVALSYLNWNTQSKPTFWQRFVCATWYTKIGAQWATYFLLIFAFIIWQFYTCNWHVFSHASYNQSVYAFWHKYEYTNSWKHQCLMFVTKDTVTGKVRAMQFVHILHKKFCTILLIQYIFKILYKLLKKQTQYVYTMYIFLPKLIILCIKE